MLCNVHSKNTKTTKSFTKSVVGGGSHHFEVHTLPLHSAAVDRNL